MASSSSSISTTSSPIKIDQSSLSPSSNTAISLSNIKYFIPIVLDYTNYMLWRELFLPVFKGHGVYGFIDGSFPCPPSTIITEDGNSILNPAFQPWVQLDSIVLSRIQATIYQEILQAILRPNHSLTSREAWLEIERLFRDQVSSRTLQLKVQFHNLKKGDLSINDYVHRLKTIADSLNSVGNPISETDLVLQSLSGLPSDYMPVSTSISTRIPLPYFTETRSLLFLHEAQLSNFSATNSDLSATAFVAKQHSTPHGRGRGRNNNGGRNSNGGRGRGRNNPGFYKNFSTPSPNLSRRPQSHPFSGLLLILLFPLRTCMLLSNVKFVFNIIIQLVNVHLLVLKHLSLIFNHLQLILMPCLAMHTGMLILGPPLT
ncbi:PREDICTED: uncharacterized protein LOC109213406 [Nicotiana attenuata]|uniref:uncharacterized protein LOC109213406 n=1 Tax=Nicotiana attenuata TaxID=49451 RepID=UPI000905D5C3|nr:PREDICTED: uncharacterized protein LOC109213406 [Nicotiana attenuata]